MLLSTVFFLARTIDTDMSVPFATILEAARESRLNAPNFSGMTEVGATFQVSAKSIKPNVESPDQIDIEAPSLTAAKSNEGEIFIRSGWASITDGAKTLTFSDLVRIEISGGYTIESRGLVADLEQGNAKTSGPLEVITPFGGLLAGQLVIELGNSDGGAKLLFQDGVKMTYRIED